MNTKSKTISITDLALDGPAQLRVSIDTKTVDEYAVKYSEALDEQGHKAAAKALGPIEVHAVGGDTILVSGHHRTLAARQAGLDELAARVTYGSTLAEAVKAAARSNSQHGLPMTNKDKRKAVNAVLDVDPDLGSRKVADLVGCSHQLVKNIKQERDQGVSNVAAKRAEAKAKADQPSSKVGSIPQETASDGPEPAPSTDAGPGKAETPEPSPEPVRPPLTTIKGSSYTVTIEVDPDDTLDLADQLDAVLEPDAIEYLITHLQNRVANRRHVEAIKQHHQAEREAKAAEPSLPKGLTGKGLEVLARKTTSGTVIYETWQDGERINKRARVSSSGRIYRWVKLAKDRPADARSPNWKRSERYGITTGTAADPHKWQGGETERETAPIKVVFTF